MPTSLLRLLISGFLLCTCALAPEIATAQTDVPFSFPSDYISNVLDVHTDATGAGFLGGSCGVLRQTTDNGLSWTVSESPTSSDIETIACPPGGCATALLATDDALYRYSGRNWTEVTYPSYEEGGNLHWLTNDLVVHEAGSDGLWRSTDGGLSWAYVPYGEQKDSELIFVDATTAYLFANAKLLKTTDGGSSFFEVGYTHPNNPFYLAWLDANTGWMFDRDRRFWKTTNGGLNWTKLNEEQQLSSLNFFLPLTADHLVAAQGITLAESTDGGVTWTRGQYGVDHIKGRGRKYHRSGTAFFLPGAENQLLYSPANFTDWVDLEGKALQSRITDLAFASNETGYAIGGVELYVTTDAGANWSVETIGSIMRELGILPNGNPVIMTDSETRVSNNQGQTFSDLFPAGMVTENEDNPDLMTIKPDGSVYFFAPNSSFLSTDGGATFARTEHGMGMFANSLFFVDDDHGYVVDRNRKFAYTSDGGLSWQLRTDVPSFSPEAVYFTSLNTGWVSSANRRYQTTDGGMTWTEATDRAGGYDFTHRTEDDAIYAARWDENTLVRSTDGGENWTALAGHCFGYRTLALTPNERYAFVAGDGFIVRHNLADLATGTRRADRPAATRLVAYPNPSSGRIWVELPTTKGVTKLSVFNVAGREVQSMEVPRGRDKVEVNLSNFPAGVYVARWSAGNGVMGTARVVKR